MFTYFWHLRVFYGHSHGYVMLSFKCLSMTGVFMSIDPEHLHVHLIVVFTCLCDMDIYMAALTCLHVQVHVIWRYTAHVMVTCMSVGCLDSHVGGPLHPCHMDVY